MGATISVHSPGGLDSFDAEFQRGTIDLSVGETLVFTGDLTHTDFTSLSGDLGLYTFTESGPGSFTSTAANSGAFTFEMTQAEWVAAGSPDTLNLTWNSDFVNTFAFPSSGLFQLSVTCFLAGTQITTPEGERAVETLEIGDLIRTADGTAVPVKWLGRQTVRTLMTASPKLEPVRIAKDALGPNVPHADLTVTGDHGMIVDGHIINAAALVNGTTIRFLSLEAVEVDFVVYHVETEEHDVILANGAPAETFIDYLGRRNFDNHDEYLALYGAERIIPELPQPRISAARHLPAHIAQRLGIETPIVSWDEMQSAAS
ncbi:Hint domain-containing protein [Pseudaestuariivita atlantica]|uniref:Hint domain-containing protein n=1 Tax=Pseudaestuariivita atlantica TaxID=1317121 RepID=UPI0009E47B78|nr:Hint domain-containing protein [Pseudaestuariivita atlantica]